MKKRLLPLFGIFGMLLASCGIASNPFTNVSKSDPAVESHDSPLDQASSSPEEPGEPPYASFAEDALQKLYSDYVNILTEGISSNFVLPDGDEVAGYRFDFVYTIEPAALPYVRMEGSTIVPKGIDGDYFFDYGIGVDVMLGSMVMASGTLPLHLLAESPVSLEEVWNLELNSSIYTTGVVTALYGPSFFIQSGPYACEVYTRLDWGVSPGQSVAVRGTVLEYCGLREIDPSEVKVIPETFGIEPLYLSADTYLEEARYVGGRMFSSDCLWVSSITPPSSPTGSFSFSFTLGSESGPLVTAKIDPRYMDAEAFRTWADLDENGNIISGSKIEVGDIVSVEKGILSWYNGPRIILGEVSIVEKGAGAPQQTYQVTIEEAVAAAMALSNSEISRDYYEFEAYAIRRENSIYVLAGSPDLEDSVPSSELFQIYKPSDANVAKLTRGAHVLIKTQVRNYKGVAEDNGSPEITVLEEGGDWYANPVEVSVAEAIQVANGLPINSSASACYQVKGKVERNYLGSDSYRTSIYLYDLNDPSISLTCSYSNLYDVTINPGDIIMLRGFLKHISSDTAAMYYGQLVVEVPEGYSEAAEAAYNSISSSFVPLASGLSEGVQLPITAEGNGYTFDVRYSIIDEGWQYLSVGSDGWLWPNRDLEEHEGVWLHVEIKSSFLVCYSMNVKVKVLSVTGDVHITIDNAFIENIDGVPYFSVRISSDNSGAADIESLGWHCYVFHNDALDEYENGLEGYDAQAFVAEVASNAIIFRMSLNVLRVGHFDLWLQTNGFVLSFNQESIDKTPVIIGNKTYVLETNEDLQNQQGSYNSTIGIRVDDPVEASKVVDVQDATMVEIDGVPYIRFIGTFENMSEEELRDLPKCFDAQVNPELDAGSFNEGMHYLMEKEGILTVTGNNYTLDYDISSLYSGHYVIRFGWRVNYPVDNTLPQEVSVGMDLNGANYGLVCNPNGSFDGENYWRNIGLIIENKPVPPMEYAVNAVSLFDDGNTPCLAFGISYANCSFAEISSLNWKLDFQNNNNVYPAGWDKYAPAFEFLDFGYGNMEIRVNLDSLPEGGFICHFGVANDDTAVPDLKFDGFTQSIIFNGRTYILEFGREDYWNCASLTVTVSE